MTSDDIWNQRLDDLEEEVTRATTRLASVADHLVSDNRPLDLAQLGAALESAARVVAILRLKQTLPQLLRDLVPGGAAPYAEVPDPLAPSPSSADA